MLNPSPRQNGIPMETRALTDAALPHSPAVQCLERTSNGSAERFHLMHDFATDILQIQFLDNETGNTILGSPFLEEELRTDPSRRDWLYSSVWLTVGHALALSGAQLLDIDPTEVAVIIREAPQQAALGNREIILYDTTAGGAGYARQLGGRIEELFQAASARLLDCDQRKPFDCQDSCYTCLRTYHNQMIHSRLHRKRAAQGVRDFVAANFKLGGR